MDGLTNSAPRILLKLMVWFRFYREYEGEYIHAINLFEQMRGNILGDYEGIGWVTKDLPIRSMYGWYICLHEWLIFIR